MRRSAVGNSMSDQHTATLGVIVAKRKSFGFIRAAEFPIDLFFHSSSAEDFHSLEVGNSVEFSVEQQQGKQVAVHVQATTRAAELVHIDSTPQHGVVGKCTIAGRQGSAFLRYMDQQGQVQHLAFTAEALAPNTNVMAPGQLVKFFVLTDRRQQLLQERQAASGGSQHAKHAYLRATQVEVLSADEKVGTMHAARTLHQQLCPVLACGAPVYASDNWPLSNWMFNNTIQVQWHALD